MAATLQRRRTAIAAVVAYLLGAVPTWHHSAQYDFNFSIGPVEQTCLRQLAASVRWQAVSLEPAKLRHRSIARQLVRRRFKSFDARANWGAPEDFYTAMFGLGCLMFAGLFAGMWFLYLGKDTDEKEDDEDAELLYEDEVDEEEEVEEEEGAPAEFFEKEETEPADKKPVKAGKRK
eukprot:TRINITY_DN61678_c0_g1_i1.p1 TRINITY_DN61678_c0_g1~~TRINITY_DN61678_c0_g1_i1.p1  ORF type:complete len:187 (+),score=37.48 TRINITY_DN61678_c0_g1_i1:35-562(+)